jgi:hypothetical protein
MCPIDKSDVTRGRKVRVAADFGHFDRVAGHYHLADLRIPMLVATFAEGGDLYPAAAPQRVKPLDKTHQLSIISFIMPAFGPCGDPVYFSGSFVGRFDYFSEDLQAVFVLKVFTARPFEFRQRSQRRKYPAG